MSSASVSAIRAGFSDPSISSVFRVFMTISPPSLGSTPRENDAQSHTSSCGHGRKKANLIDPVVEAGRGVFGDDTNLHGQRGQQCERQIAVSDRTAVRTFPFRPFDVDVNPLMIASARRKRIDPCLVDRNPIGHAELLPDSFAQTRKGKTAHIFLLD